MSKASYSGEVLLGCPFCKLCVMLCWLVSPFGLVAVMVLVIVPASLSIIPITSRLPVLPSGVVNVVLRVKPVSLTVWTVSRLTILPFARLC